MINSYPNNFLKDQFDPYIGPLQVLPLFSG